MKNKENLMKTLDVKTQLRQALKAVDELTLENKELTEQLNLACVMPQRELLKAFYEYCYTFYFNAKHLSDRRIDGFIKSL